MCLWTNHKEDEANGCPVLFYDHLSDQDSQLKTPDLFEQRCVNSHTMHLSDGDTERASTLQLFRFSSSINNFIFINNK